ncbi:MAG: secretion protein [Deltaproteobacteria bacterium]|nr:secretion protein [Deltaproteobacteria bacterium]
MTRSRWRALSAVSWALSLAACDVTLATGLAESEANQVVVALDREGIGAEKREAEGGDEGFAVHVSPDDVAPALAVLRASGLPRAPEPGLAQMFTGQGLVPTPTEERARYAVGLAGDLARSIEAIDGIVDARVHLAIPERDPARLDEPEASRPRPTASLLVRHRGAQLPTDANGLRSLVAGAVEGMRREDVTVVAVPVPSAPSREGRTGLVRVGPVSVTRGSAGPFRLFVGAALCGHVVLALLLAVVALRKRKPAPAEPAAA